MLDKRHCYSCGKAYLIRPRVKDDGYCFKCGKKKHPGRSGRPKKEKKVYDF